MNSGTWGLRRIFWGEDFLTYEIIYFKFLFLKIKVFFNICEHIRKNKQKQIFLYFLTSEFSGEISFMFCCLRFWKKRILLNTKTRYSLKEGRFQIVKKIWLFCLINMKIMLIRMVSLTFAKCLFMFIAKMTRSLEKIHLIFEKVDCNFWDR